MIDSVEDKSQQKRTENFWELEEFFSNLIFIYYDLWNQKTIFRSVIEAFIM